MICRPCHIASCRQCIVKYNSLSYACIYIPGSPEQSKWISCGLFLWNKYAMNTFWQSYWCHSEFSTHAAAPARRI